MYRLPDTRTVTVYDMTTGSRLRTTTTAGEARRAAELPTAGMTINDRIAGVVPTPQQVKARQARALRHAEAVALLEATKDAHKDFRDQLAKAGRETAVERHIDTDWQDGYDF